MKIFYNPDRAMCVFNDQRFTVTHFSATSELARRLVEAGVPDQPWESHAHDGARSLYGSSLHRWARTIVVGDDFVPYERYERELAKTRDRERRKREAGASSRAPGGGRDQVA